MLAVLRFGMIYGFIVVALLASQGFSLARVLLDEAFHIVGRGPRL